MRKGPAVADDTKKPADDKPPLKADLVAEAIDRGIPSYEAWAMTVDELKKKLEA